MACNDPIAGWKSRTPHPLTRKRGVVFDLSQGEKHLPINIACGKCFGCLLAKSREWATRCSHEASLHEYNSFITLSYDSENLPRTPAGLPTLYPKHFTNFMKKLRKRQPGKLLYLQAGEYGKKKNRPHHHVLVFNCNFPDKTYWRKSGNYTLYRSEQLESIWEKGHSEIGTVTMESAGYVARYTMKADNTPPGAVPEYMTMSRNPAIGKKWLDQYFSDVYPSDEIATMHGPTYRPPRYYDKILEKQHPELYKTIRTARNARLTAEIRSGDRQTARERILRAQAQERIGDV